MNVKSLLITVPDFENEFIMIAVLVYWIVFTSIIEEWFWRNFMWGVLYNDRAFEKFWIAASWGLMYCAVVFFNTSIQPALIIGVLLLITGYILAPFVRYEWSYSGMIYL